MKPLKIIPVLMICMIISMKGLGQKGRGHGHHHGHGGNKVVVVKRSNYRPHKVLVYHPVWRPNYGYNRRWVFFPKYNFYWDNWRNHYMFWNGTVWISQQSPPPTVININLSTEKNYELKEADDDNDHINSSNENHKTEYKPD